ncbi:MAG TPA: hypothetical protein VED17_02905, partial [Nitrososphaerales archaeon]|nr:hypothetical protein [Nitrososphaerales archaeon]
MDAEKNKKLQQYATILTDQAKEAEQAGKSDEAIKHYLKLVDVFLVLASEATDHTTWMQYIRQAEAYQTRIRSLVPKDQATQDIGSRIPPPPSERGSSPVNVRRPEPALSTATGNPQGIPPQSSARTNPISKILKPFQSGREIGNPLEEYTSNILQTPNLRQQPAPPISPAPPVNSPQAAPPKPAVAPVEERPPVPHEVYDRALSENKVLHERLQDVMKETDEKTAFLESRNRELEDRVAMMVPKSDYDQLRLEFENMVPKHEYDRLKSELANTVPISHYDQLLDRIANMVPREIYMTSERRILELEDNLRRSVPLAVIDDIANEVSYVSILAEVPPIVNEPSKKEGKEADTEDLVKEESTERSS